MSVNPPSTIVIQPFSDEYPDEVVTQGLFGPIVTVLSQLPKQVSDMLIALRALFASKV
jgi:hypothetical protein